MSSTQLLPAIHELFSKHPEYWHHESWELQWILYALNYTDELENEGEIVAAVAVAGSDWPRGRAA